MRLPQPTHACVEKHEHHETEGDSNERAFGLVDNDFVDNHLREERRRQADHLDEERCKQHIAPDTLMLEKFLPEPSEAELLRRCITIADDFFCHFVAR
jgi:hypothetical protein